MRAIRQVGSGIYELVVVYCSVVIRGKFIGADLSSVNVEGHVGVPIRRARRPGDNAIHVDRRP